VVGGEAAVAVVGNHPISSDSQQVERLVIMCRMTPGEREFKPDGSHGT